MEDQLEQLQDKINTTVSEQTHTSKITTPVPSPSEKIQLSPEDKANIEHIVSTYMKIYHVVFGRGFYMVLTLIALIGAWRLSVVNADTKFPTRDTEILQKESIAQRQYIVNFKSAIHDSRIQLLVQQGLFTIKDNVLRSIDNLASYQGLILPISVQLPLLGQTSDFLSVNNLQGINSMETIDRYLQVMIYTSYSRKNAIERSKSSLLPLSKSVIEYFDLSCMLYPQLPYNFCDNYFSTIIPLLPLYRLSSDYNGLTQLAEMKNTTHFKEMYCNALLEYAFNANDNSPNMKNVITHCPPRHIKEFDNFTAFISIQEQLLQLAQINSNITQSSTLNTYKLLSTMQQIYVETQNSKTLNTTRIDGYIAYVRNLLRNKDAIAHYYFDIIARYNNSFLIPVIKDASLKASKTNSTIYKTLLDSARELNRGSVYNNFPALNDMVSSDELKVEETEYTDSTSNTGAFMTDLESFFQENYKFSSYIVQSSQVLGPDQLSVQGLLRFTNPDEVGLANNTPLTVRLNYKKSNQQFVAESVQLAKHPELTQAVNLRLEAGALNISELYNLIITTNALLSNQTTGQEVCKVFTRENGAISCSEKSLTLIKDNYTYIFSYTQQDGVKNYSVNDKKREEILKKEFGMPVVITKDPVSAINLLIGYTITDSSGSHPDPDKEHTGGMIDIQIQNDINDIGGEIKSITTQDGYYIVNFSIKTIQFVGVYDFPSRSLLGLGILQGTDNYPIRNFKLQFTTISSNDKSLIASDPISYLIKFDPLSIKKLGF